MFTEKVDGTNIRVGFVGETISFGGRTYKADIPSFLMDALESKFLPMSTVFSDIFGDADVCLYGEGYGPKIQGGGKYRRDHSFVLFDININGWWLDRANVEGIASQLGIEIVPIIGYGTLDEMVTSAKKGFTSQWGDFEAEGYVARPSTELRCRNGERVITKIKCKDFK